MHDTFFPASVMAWLAVAPSKQTRCSVFFHIIAFGNTFFCNVYEVCCTTLGPDLGKFGAIFRQFHEVPAAAIISCWRMLLPVFFYTRIFMV